MNMLNTGHKIHITGSVECFMELNDPTRNNVQVGELDQSWSFGVLHRPVAKINPRQVYGSLPVDAGCLDVTVYCEAYSLDLPCTLLWEHKGDNNTTRKHLVVSTYYYDEKM